MSDNNTKKANITADVSAIVLFDEDRIKADFEADRIEARLLSKKYGREITVEQMKAVEYHVRQEARKCNPPDFDKFSETIKESIYSSKNNNLDDFVKMQREEIKRNASKKIKPKLLGEMAVEINRLRCMFL